MTNTTTQQNNDNQKGARSTRAHTTKTHPQNWVETTLGEVVKFHYGKSLTALKRVNGKVPVYGSSGIAGYHNDPLINKKGLIIGRKGTVGSLYKSSVPFYPIDTVFYLTEDDFELDFMFLYYFIKTLRLDEKSGDSAVPGLNRNEAYSISIKFPADQKEQKSIAAVLSSFDDKIELLREQNKTLEQTAQTIFKEWFGKYSVDKPEELPDGWRVERLSEIADLKSGYAFKGKDFVEDSKNKALKIKDLKGRGIVNLSDISNVSDDVVESKKVQFFKLEKGDIVLAMSGNTTGKIGIIPPHEMDLFLNQRVGKFFLKKVNLRSFLYFFLMSGNFEEKILNMGYGSAQPNISPIQIGNIQIIFPEKSILEKYLNLVNPMFKKILDNKEQIQTLTKTRDALLPRLMKGKVKVEF